MKKRTDLKGLTEVELKDKLQEERTSLTKLRFAHTVTPIESPVQLRTKRKEVARILTELRMRELANKTTK